MTIKSGVRATLIIKSGVRATLIIKSEQLCRTLFLLISKFLN